MYGRLTGEVVLQERTTVTIDVQGVGYEVTVSEPLLAALGPDPMPATLYIRTITREDGTTLYGFADPQERRVFDWLLTVTGCGPKVAMSLLSQVGEASIVTAIAQQDSKALTRASGVGTKLAERIVLELKDKMGEEMLSRRLPAMGTAVAVVKSGPVDDLVEALMALGYRRAEAEVARDAAPEDADMPTRLRAALAVLRK